MTQAQAEYLANAYGYRARKMHGRWCVWCDESDHVVEFDAVTVDAALSGSLPRADDEQAAIARVENGQECPECGSVAIKRPHGLSHTHKFHCDDCKLSWGRDYYERAPEGDAWSGGFAANH